MARDRMTRGLENSAAQNYNQAQMILSYFVLSSLVLSFVYRLGSLWSQRLSCLKYYIIASEQKDEKEWASSLPEFVTVTQKHILPVGPTRIDLDFSTSPQSHGLMEEVECQSTTELLVGRGQMGHE